ncbi:MAG: hypothetical protein ACK59M_08850 [Pseudomonadota bacterium]|jgi:hypothetical protein
MHTHCPAVLAIELRGPAPASLPTVPTEQAALLVDAVAADLARLLPGVESLGLAVAGALFDVAQVLRPGWPLFHELALLYRRERRGDRSPAVMGLGTAGGRMASPVLEPEPGLGGGPLVLVPFVLVGEDAMAQAIGARMELVFTEQGLAGAAVPLFLSQGLGLEVEHARYMTRFDLCALLAIQLDHAGLGPLWPLLEAALLAPGASQFVRSAGGAGWRCESGSLRGAAFGFDAWARGPGTALDPASRAEGFAETLLMQRRAAGLLTAHGLLPAWVAADPGLDEAALEAALVAGPLLEVARVDERPLPDATSAGRAAAGDGPRRVVALSHPTLGTAGFAVIAGPTQAPQVIARAWPLDEAAARGARAALARALDADPAGGSMPLALALGPPSVD